MRAPSPVATALCILTACGFPQPAPFTADASTHDALTDAGAPACPTPADGTVVACAFDTYVVEVGKLRYAPRDLSSATIKAYVADGSGFRVVMGVGSSDGTATIAGVPDGSYDLEVDEINSGRNLYVTSSRSPDLGEVVEGRPGVPVVTKPSPLTIALSGMTAWQAGDDLLMESPGAGFSFDLNSFLSTSNPPMVGDIALHVTVDLQSADPNSYTPPLIDASQGDSLYLVHITGSGSSVDAFSSNTTTVVDGEATTITGAFSHVPQSLVQSDRFSESAFDTIYDHGTFESLVARSTVETGPVAAFEPTFLTLARSEPTVNGDSTVDVSYGDPWPEVWPRITVDRVQRQRALSIPGTSGLGSVFTVYEDARPRISPHTIAPLTEFPTNLEVGGAAALESATARFDGTAPVLLQWTQTNRPSHFEVTVNQVSVQGGFTRADNVAVLRTTDTHVLIPPDVFVAGQRYVFVVKAVVDSTNYAGGVLLEPSIPRTVLPTTTGPVLVSPSCGNGKKDADEECDTSGESATCNADCSVARCGDGIANVHAGEQCDAGTNSVSCDQTCHTVSTARRSTLATRGAR